MGILSGLKKAATFALDLTSAVARNPLAILSPVKEAAKIKELRTQIASGDKSGASAYVKTVAVQTALNVGTVLGGAGVLGAGTKAAVTAVTSKAVVVGAIAAPLIVASPTIRSAVASFSPVAAGVALGEKIETGVQAGKEGSNVAAAVIGTAVAGGVAAAGLIGAKYLYDEYKENKAEKELQTSSEMPDSISTAVLPTNKETPKLPATQTITTGTGLTSKRKKKRSKAVVQPQNIVQRTNILIQNRNSQNKLTTKKYLNGIALKN